MNQNHFFIILLLFFIQVSSQSTEQVQNDLFLCMSHIDTSTCSDVKLSTSYMQCCSVETTMYRTSYTQCSLHANPIGPFKQLMELPSTKAINKEIYGYIIYGEGYDVVGIDIDLLRTSIDY